MKTLKTIFLLLLVAGGAFGQIVPDNMFISGYVLDSNGQAVPNQFVCVSYISNNPALPSDSVCTSTNNNGYYFIEIVNGSLIGGNVTFEVTTYDPCSFIMLSETVSNNQGTVDVANVDFTICANSIGCQAQIIYTLDSTVNGPVYTFTASGSGGTAPYNFLWMIAGNQSIDNPVTYIPSPNEIFDVCLTVADNAGCTSTSCDTIYVGDPNPGCSVEITTTVDSTGGGLVYTLTASGGFSQYVWSSNQVGQSITVQNISPNGEVYCVSATDGNGCTATACDTLLPFNGGGGCQAGFWYPGISPGGSGTLYVGDTLQLFFNGSSSNSNAYLWTVSVAGMSWTSTEMNPWFAIPPTLIPINGVLVEICVTVTNSATNCTDTYCETVTALPDNSGNCSAAFAWEPDSILGGPLPAVWFYDNSTNAAAWFWDFGDGTTSTDQNPVHAYSGTGIYGVCLTIISADQSCQNTYCDTVYVGNNTGGCNASFSNSGPTPIGYTFTANVQSPNYSYSWEIDGVVVGSGYEAYAPGFINGVHTICLTISDGICSDTQCLTITVGNNNCYGYVSGAVFAGSNNNPLDVGVVYLITFDQNTNQLTAVDSMVVDSGNYYFFGPLACGDYLIKAAAYPASQYYSSHIPTYYGNSPFWGFAETVTLAQVNTQVTADINLIAATNPGGPGFIGGDVTEGANKMDPGDPLSGMEVILFNMNGQAIAYTYTDANGAFGFEDLAWGTYQVYVEQVGVQTIPAVVTIGPDTPSVDDVHIFAGETLISTGIMEVDFEGAFGEVYPNPTVNEASVRFNLETATDATVKILDLSGRSVSTEAISLSSGENVLKVSADGLTEGYYFLNIQDVDGNFSITRKFMRID